MILGDLNTMGHGIARFSPNFCCDKMRFWSIGRTEGEVWERDVFSQLDPEYTGERRAIAGQSTSASQLKQANMNAILHSYGLSTSVCHDILNPGTDCHLARDLSLFSATKI